MERRSETMKERKNEGVTAQMHDGTTARKNDGADDVMNLTGVIRCHCMVINRHLPNLKHQT